MNKTPINFGYNSNKIILRELNIQPNSKYHDDSKKILKKEYFISTKDIPSYSATQLYTQQVSTYSTQQVSNYYLPQQLSTQKVSDYSAQQLFDYIRQQNYIYSNIILKEAVLFTPFTI